MIQNLTKDGMALDDIVDEARDEFRGDITDKNREFAKL